MGRLGSRPRANEHAEDSCPTSNIQHDFIFEKVAIVDDGVAIGFSADLIFLRKWKHNQYCLACVHDSILTHQHLLMDTCMVAKSCQYMLFKASRKRHNSTMVVVADSCQRGRIDQLSGKARPVKVMDLSSVHTSQLILGR